MLTEDTLLIQRWAERKDSEAFRELVRRHAGMVFATSRRILRNAADAEDVTQECLLKLSELRRPARNVGAWLHRVATHRAIDVRRAHTRRREVEGRWEPPAASTEDLEWHEMESVVDEVIAELPERVRAPLVLYYLRSQTQEDVASALGVSQATVSLRVREGVESIRRQLGRRGRVRSTAALATWLSTRTTEAAPASLLERLGKLALVGRIAASRGPAGLSGTTLNSSLTRAWPMKLTLASVAGLVLIGTIVLALFESPHDVATGSNEPAPASAPTSETEPALAVPATPSRPIEESLATPAPPRKSGAVLVGVVRGPDGTPRVGADVYLAPQPPLDLDLEGEFLRPDYFRRSRLLRTRTDANGRYVFERVPSEGYATLGAFHEGHSGASEIIGVRAGERSEVDLDLSDGETLRATVQTADGLAVDDAVVSVLQCWSATGHVFRGAGLAPTDALGRVRVGLGAGAIAAHVRVNSDRHGQHLFEAVPLKKEGVVLTLPELARVSGTITWEDGSPAAGFAVRARGQLPEPEIPVRRLGRRPQVTRDGQIGEDGRFSIEGLHPHVRYDLVVIDPALGERLAGLRALSPRLRDTFVPEPGESLVWDQEFTRPITVRGKIRTETSGKPLARGRVGVKKDGETLELVWAEANDEGDFVLHLVEGPGEYLVHAEPPGRHHPVGPVVDLLAEKFGVRVDLAAGEEVEVELSIFEPTVLPLRVLDADGNPPRDLRVVLHAEIADGEIKEHSMACALDDEGRTSLAIFAPAPEFWFECYAGSSLAPRAETRRHESRPGNVLEEETLVLPRTCRLTATLLDAKGELAPERYLKLRVNHDDGSTQELSVSTNSRGWLEEEGRVRAAAFVLELLSRKSEVLWTSPRLDASGGGWIELGEIVLAATED